MRGAQLAAGVGAQHEDPLWQEAEGDSRPQPQGGKQRKGRCGQFRSPMPAARTFRRALGFPRAEVDGPTEGSILKWLEVGMGKRYWLMATLLLLLSGGGLWAETTEDSYQQKDAALAPTDASGHFDLAMWCRTNNLMARYREQLEKAIAINPEHEPARKLLGYEKVDGKWYRGDELLVAKGMVQYQGKWVTKEFKENSEKGMVLRQGKWMTEEEWNKSRGYVKYHGTWIPQSRLKSIQARLQKVRERIKLASDWKNAWQNKTEHFLITSNVSPQSVEEIGKAMEMCYVELAKIFEAKANLKAIAVDVFATQNQFIEYTARAMSSFPITPNTLGYFYSSGPGIRCFYPGDLDRTLSTLFHECTHLVIDQTCGQAPTWFNEGMAVFFESAERGEKGMKLQTIPFHRLWHLQLMLKEGELSLNALCRNPGGKAYTGECYPQGWSLVYYLFYAEKGRYRNLLQAYYNQLTKRGLNEDGVEGFKKGFGVEPDQLAPAWRKYMEEMVPKTTDDLVAATDTALSSWLDFSAAQHFATEALKSVKGRNDKVQLCNARLNLALGRWALPAQGQADFYAKAVDFFEQVFPPKGQDGKPAPAKVVKFNRAYVIDHLDFARACIGAKRYDQAQNLIEDVLNRDEYCADAYSCLAFLAVSADDPEFHDLEVAKENAAIADDLGANPENLYVHALIDMAENHIEQAAKRLNQAASLDEYGFGGRFYRRELMRLAMTKNVSEKKPDGEKKPDPEKKPEAPKPPDKATGP
jgi:tetratricopeptide (TPR) repeat protein